MDEQTSLDEYFEDDRPLCVNCFKPMPIEDADTSQPLKMKGRLVSWRMCRKCDEEVGLRIYESRKDKM